MQPRLLCLVLALITLLLYLPVWQHEFIVYDDDLYVTENRMVQRGLTWAGVKWAFTTLHASNWHPLTWLSHMLDWQLFGANAGAHHLVNVLFHTANTVLLFLLIRRMTASVGASAVVAALFAWHPLHIQSVAWIAERKDVLCAFFGLLALHAYLRYASESSRSAYIFSLLFFALGLIAKPMLVTLPCVFLLLDYWPLKRARNFVSLALEKWPFFLLTALSCVVTIIAQRESAMVDFEHQPFGARLSNALAAYSGYLTKTFAPVKLAIVYPLEPLPWPRVAVSAALMAVISFFAWRCRAAQPYFIVGWLWFVGMLVPVIGLLQVGLQAMADRYTYLPLVGIFIAVVLGARDLAIRSRLNAKVNAAIATLALLVCAAATLRELSYWRDSEALFSRAVAVTKDNPVARVNLGQALEAEGRNEEALSQYREALRIGPLRAQAHNNIANVLAALGKKDEALQHYHEALRPDGKAPVVHLNLGSLLLELDRFEEALQHYAEAARQSSGDPRPLYLMGKARLQQKQTAQALAHFRDALRLDPDYVRALTWTARVLTSDKDSNLRNAKEALAFAQRANELTGGSEPFVMDTLAMAYAEAGRFAEAARTVDQAIAIATRTGAKEDAAAMRQRLELYRAGQPHRE